MKNKEWKFVAPAKMTLKKYPCGVKEGDIIALKKDLTYRGCNGEPTGDIKHAGEQAVILSGNPNDPDIVWLKWHDGDRETWDSDILETFEIIGKAT